MKVERSQKENSTAIRLTISDSKEYEAFKNILEYARRYLSEIPYGLQHTQMKKDIEILKKLMKEI